ncbi:EamA family transporter [Desulfovibrio sp. ZJ369]|uniref:EamA family transporter n=1 Tax=Desulfovibrio sp. ZJ369 TaxID=2709793 RepID=UPI0013EABD38|nr:EamA family transporter [Desulfovibrio sp. ZJ369]
MWKVYALLAALFAALTAIFSKMGVKDVDSNLATAVRVTFILALTWGIVIFTGVAGRVKELSGHTLLFLFLSAVATGLSWLFYFKALQLGEVSRVAPIDKLSVPLAMILAALLLHEPLGLKAVAGGLLITLGSLLLLL